jgi:hypothetical protein
LPTAPYELNLVLAPAARLRLSDGTTQDVRFPVQLWGPCTTGSNCMHVTASVPVKADVVGVRLWPGITVPDWNPSNDTWGNAPAAEPVQPSTAGGLMTPIGNR